MPIPLDVLAEKSVAKDFNNAGSFPGLNSVCKTQVHVDDWHPWEDFTYDTIKQIFEKELSRRYKGESEPQPLPLDLRVLKEDATQDALGRFPIPIVNYALNSIGGTEHFGRGSRCYQHGVYIPDWSVVSQSHVGVTGGMLNILPGDTKISSKWWSSMLKDFDNFDEWKKVLDQIVTYMASCSVRYGFIVTDTEVVALRITRQHVPKGLASSRTRREPGSKAPIIISSDPASHTSSEGFQDTDPLLWDYRVEYKAVPWSVHGKERLTGKLALWALARMASCGDRGIEYSYPDLDTWRTNDTSDGIIHNTSGAELEKPTKHTEIQERSHFLPAAAGAESPDEDLYNDDRETSLPAPAEIKDAEEPELPQLIKAVSTTRLEETIEAPVAQAAEDQKIPKIIAR